MIYIFSLNSKLKIYFLNDDRVLNCNIGYIENRNLKSCFKGSSDECNNSMYITYSYHKQKYENQITTLIERFKTC